MPALVAGERAEKSCDERSDKPAAIVDYRKIVTNHLTA